MMDQILIFFQTDTVIAFLTALFIFFVTIFLVIKRWIGFSLTLLLLLFAITAGVVIRHHRLLESYLLVYKNNEFENQESLFQKQFVQAVSDIKGELSTENDNFQKLVNQVEDMFDQMDAQTQKLQTFIDEARERFKSDEVQSTQQENTNIAKDRP